ncbi:adenylate kinase [Cardiosporidium cionae]|uniref:Adenylate kinase n=1 Tax=Cardiosporidium cionae TaxID=476202 RepID=A0ABQ7JDR4_9APIC|nr:adenylate kinase [Cardiosporidium cionae]|eukprot:KAF8822045.1 adenylate kinase [Cardiosporidium cionae]
MSSAIENVPTVDLLSELKRRYTCLTKPEGRFVFMGAPGSGKGTQASELRRSHCFCHLSTGDLLREAVDKGTKLGMEAKVHMDSGELVDDSIVSSLVKDKIASPECRRGFILDGYPRTVAQAQSMPIWWIYNYLIIHFLYFTKLNGVLEESKLRLNGVLFFDVPEEQLERRVCGRRVHPESGRVYHTDFNPPKIKGTDDMTGEALIIRKDDNVTSLKSRLAAFNRETTPLLAFYSNLGLLRQINAALPATEVTKQMYDVIDKA